MALTVFWASYVAAGPSDLRVLTLGGYELELLDFDGTCAVRLAEKYLDLGIPAPCQFLGDGRTVTSHQYGATTVVLVGGPAAAESDYRSLDAVTAAQRCSHIGRGLLVNGERVSLTPVMVERVGFCPSIAPDEKVYYAIAHAG